MPRPSFLTLLSVVVLCGLMATLGFALNYQYFSNDETTRLGGRINFWHGDTLTGPIRSNDTLSVVTFPVLYDYVISCASALLNNPPWPDLEYPLHCYFNADSLHLLTTAAHLREQALAQNHFYVGDDSLRARVRLEDHNLHVWWLDRYPPVDTLLETDYPLADSAVVFFDFPEVDLYGTVNSVLVLGASGRIGLADNVLYASADPLSGRAPEGHTEKLAVVAEGEIKVLNTWANGRENSNGLGQNQTNPDSTSIVLDGIYAALNRSFTFENQNDPDSGYVCACQPDDRGTIFLYGSLIQQQRSYVHRTTRGSTGYVKNYRYDPDLKFWNLPLFTDARENELDREFVDFGEIALGDTARDTLTIYNDYVPLQVDSIHAAPFAVGPRSIWAVDWHPRIAVAFAPQSPGIYETVLAIPIPYYNTTLAVTLRGTCTASGVTRRAEVLPQTFTLSASPNPFNATTRIAFTLPVAGSVRVTVYDVTGHEIETLLNQPLVAGSHEALWDAAANPTGVYFVRLTSSTETRTAKLMLLK